MPPLPRRAMGVESDVTIVWEMFTSLLSPADSVPMLCSAATTVVTRQQVLIMFRSDVF